jgi:hypothetical protein
MTTLAQRLVETWNARNVPTSVHAIGKRLDSRVTLIRDRDRGVVTYVFSDGSMAESSGRRNHTLKLRTAPLPPAKPLPMPAKAIRASALWADQRGAMSMEYVAVAGAVTATVIWLFGDVAGLAGTLAAGFNIIAGTLSALG